MKRKFELNFNKAMITIIALFFWYFIISIHLPQINAEVFPKDITNKFQYISPIPDSKLNSVGTNIIIRFGTAYDENSLLKKSLLKVTGSKSGIHTGEILLAEDNNTLIFNPYSEFEPNEKITVELKGDLQTISGETIPGLKFSFGTSKANLKRLNTTDKYIKNFFQDKINRESSFENINLQKKDTLKDISLPEDYPTTIVSYNEEPSPGYLFFTPIIFPSSGVSSFLELLPTYLIITDEYGIPVFYRKMKAPTFDFKKQRTGVLTYFDLNSSKYFIMDSSYNIIDSVGTVNYPTDIHELEVLENNHYLLMSYDYQLYPMDTVITGGNPDAIVAGLIIQELDENKNVVFQWRSWDHYKITDATYNYDLRDSVIDYVHGNAIEMDFDGNLLISSRHLDEVTKIDRKTGNIIWRFGGEHCRNNQFKFINDPIGFSHQHDVRRLQNGNILIFDNGNLHDPPFSRVVEYQVDEENKLAFLVWEYRNDPEIFSAFMGSARRLDNHNTVIGWGSTPNPAISEVSALGNIVFQMTFPDTILNYRAFKVPWKSNLLKTSPEQLNYGYVPVGDSLEKPITLINNSDEDIIINELYHRESAFKPNFLTPIRIPASSHVTVNVMYKPDTEGENIDNMHLRMNKEDERITQVVSLIGTTDSTVTSVDLAGNKSNYFLYQNFPNPFNPSTKIKFAIPISSHVNVTIYDILGQRVKILLDDELKEGNHEIEFSVSENDYLPSGVYIYTLKAGDYTFSKKMILLK